MKYSNLYKMSKMFSEVTENYFKKIANPPPAKTEGQQKAIFDIWMSGLNPSFNNKIETVIPDPPVFLPKDGKPARTDAPVCLVESTEGKPSENYIFKKPAFIFRFGTFDEQPYQTADQQKAYALKVLRKYTTYSDKDMFIESMFIDDVDYQIRNKAYEGMVVAVFFKDIEED